MSIFSIIPSFLLFLCRLIVNNTKDFFSNRSSFTTLTYFLSIALITLYPTSASVILAGKLLFMLISASLILTRRDLDRVLLVPLLVLCVCYCSVFWSISASQSFNEALRLTYYVLIFLFFRYTNFNQRYLMWGIRVLVGVSVIIAIDGVYQHLYGYQEYFRYLDTSQEVIPQVMVQTTRNWIVALSGRVFSRFALPSQLAGYLLMIFPLNVLLLIREKYVPVKIFWGIVCLLNSIIFFYTKSFGAWLSLLCMLMITAYLWFTRKHEITWAGLLKGSLGFFTLGGVIFYVIGLVRGQYLWDFQGNNPLWYRFLNWKIAFQMFLDHPFLGTGLFTFGKMYPQYMLPGANETQYVHNTYLQFGAELGIIGLLTVIYLAVAWIVQTFTRLKTLRANRRNDHAQQKLILLQPELYFFLSGVGFLLHNIIDFTFYVFPLGVLGIALLALTLNAFCSPEFPDFNDQKILKNPKLLAAYGIILCVLLMLYVKDWQYVQAARQKELAVSAIQREHYQEAYPYIQQALQYTPRIPEYQALEGSIFLYLKQTEPAIRSFQIAIRHEPETPWFHAGLAEALLSNHNMSMAYVESRRAAELFPQKAGYQKRTQEIRDGLSEL